MGITKHRKKNSAETVSLYHAYIRGHKNSDQRFSISETPVLLLDNYIAI